MHRLAKQMIGIVALTALAACGRPSVPFEEMLSESAFSEPVSAQVNASVLPPSGRFSADRNTLLFVFLVREGVLTIGPSSREPWWEYRHASSVVNANGHLAAPLGRRAIIRRTDQRRWQSDDVGYYAETLVYDVEFDEGLRSLARQRIGPFSARLVLQHDPRVGEWQVESLDYLGTGSAGHNDEPEQIDRLVAPIAQAGFSELASKVEQARSAAFDAIEASLSESGRLARGQNDQVLVSTQSRLAFYVGYASPLQAANWANADARLSAANQMCGRVSAPPYSGWRVPTVTELGAVMEPASHVSGYTELVDTPDRRLWGSFLMEPQRFELLTSEIEVREHCETMDCVFHNRVDIRDRENVSFRVDGVVNVPTERVLVRSRFGGTSRFSSRQDTWKLICVAVH